MGHIYHYLIFRYSHLFNKRGGRNKRGGVAKNAKSLNVEVGINEGGIFWKKLVHNSNKRGVEKSKKSINVEGRFLFCGEWNFSKLVSMGPTFIREMRVDLRIEVLKTF